MVSIMLSFFFTYRLLPELVHSTYSDVKEVIWRHPYKCAVFLLITAIHLKALQQKLRFARLETIKKKHSYTEDPASWKNMTVKQAQEIERNIAEWEFPRLFQFAWISDFLRTSTDPGVSRALVQSGHMVNPDPM